MTKAFGRMWTPDLAGADLEQRWRVFAAERLGVGPWLTRMAVREELREARGDIDEGPLANVTPMELLGVYDRVEQAKTSSERYAILAEPLPDHAQLTSDKHTVWFDAIHGLTSPHIIKSIGQAAHELAAKNGKLWEKAVDLGTGTGNLAAVLLGKSGVPRSVGELTTIDREQPLLDIAHQRYPEATHLHGDVTALPFPDASVDLVTSGGLAYGLDRNTRAKLFREVARVLRPGGMYLDGDYRNGFLHPDNVYVGPKHDLESMIVSHIAPSEIVPEKVWGNPNGVSEEAYFAQFGLSYALHAYRGKRPNEITDVRVLQKSV